MKLAAIEIVGMFLSFLILAVAVVLPLILLVLCIRALWIYIKTHTKAQEVKKETAAVRKTLGRDPERPPHPLPHDPGICGREPGGVPSGRQQMGDRRLGPQHVQPGAAGQALRRAPGRTPPKCDPEHWAPRPAREAGLFGFRACKQQCGGRLCSRPPQRDPIFRDAKVLLFWCDQQQKEYGSIPLCRHIGWVFYPSVQVVSGTCAPLISSPRYGAPGVL